MRRGWWALEPGALQETDITTLAQNVYFYADAQDLIFVWNGDRDVNPPRRTVETRAFTVEDDAQLTGPGSKTVSFFRATVGLDARTFTQTFNCN
jgi:hypothetical protein